MAAPPAQQINWKDAGKVMILPRGVYDETVEYDINDLVSYQLASYICIRSCVGVLPSDTRCWQKFDIGVEIATSSSPGIVIPDNTSISVDSSGVLSVKTTFSETTGVADNIISGDPISTIWSKIRNWFSRLHSVAFSGSYGDLNNRPNFLSSGSQTESSTSDGGKNVFTFTNDDGTKSNFTVYNGQKGSTGATGPQGPSGSNGTNGSNGVSCTHSWSGTTLTITSASGTSSANLKGDTGATGPQGPKGDTGATGPQGPAGSTSYNAGYATSAGDYSRTDSGVHHYTKHHYNNNFNFVDGYIAYGASVIDFSTDFAGMYAQKFSISKSDIGISSSTIPITAVITPYCAYGVIASITDLNSGGCITGWMFSPLKVSNVAVSLMYHIVY